jgi:hypothetical protein
VETAGHTQSPDGFEYGGRNGTWIESPALGICFMLRPMWANSTIIGLKGW